MKLSSFTIIVAFLCVALAGVALIPLLPVKLMPSHTLPRLTVQYQFPGNSSRIVEMQVTAPLEGMLSRIRGIKEIRSTSGNGWGRITIELDKHTDVDAVRFETSTIVRQTWPDLPDGMTYPVVTLNRPDDQELRPFLSYTLNAAAAPVFIRRFAEEQMKPQLADIAGVYRIDITGATSMEWRLEYDHHQLAMLEVTVEDLQKAIAQYFGKEFLGIVNRSENGREWIRLVLTPEVQTGRFDPSVITLTGKDGKQIYLDQLLKVTREEEKPTAYYRINGLNSVYLSLYADETANQLRLAAKVKEAMADMHVQLPAGYEIHTSYDATEFIQEELDKIYFRSGLTMLILLVFVMLITRNVRYLFLIAVSLTINLCVALIFYYLFHLEIQLYSLAGVTISLSLIIDNTIVMADHIKNRHNFNAFLPILAATLTTVGALVIIFFLDESIRLNLQDFAAVLIINLMVSLPVALFLVPALVDRMKMFRDKPSYVRPRSRVMAGLQRFARRLPVYFSRYYTRQVVLTCRRKKLLYLLLVLGFGLPVFMLPDKIEMKSNSTYSHLDSVMIGTYNRWTANETYKEKIKPAIDKALGGSLRLFVQKVYEGSYFTRREETVLTVIANLPNGATLEQMNHLVGRMEAYLSTYGEIRQFQTDIYNARQARINIFFTRKSERTGFPYTLKSRIISKALELGGGSWGVWGLQDQGFSNDVRENAGSYQIEMYGYNYDELYAWAEQIRNTLLSNRRIKEVIINSEYSWYKDDYQEFYFELNRARMAEARIRPMDLFARLSPVFGTNMYAGSILVDNEPEALRLNSVQSKEYDIWKTQHMPLTLHDTPYKLSSLASVEKGQMPQQVAKINQQYRLCLQYEYIGAANQGRKMQERIVEEFNLLLPIGYSVKAESHGWGWMQKSSSQYGLLLLIIGIIFITSGILFNSLRQPLVVIFVIPISYIGVFLTFYLFRLNFDQGGFASFVLLCGITVNASIYILNEYNEIRRRKPLMPASRAYLKAWNMKIVPIFLTVISTVLGFIPFMLGETKEAFWFPLAAGTIGGLLMSMAGIFFYLPIFLLKKSDTRIQYFR
ncbi:MAG: efflux RND transporter permease subunit [Tannerella sp.]|jgi:multidrug efflux pump subunit AcrB|nr:efflux RND transporter permease subunit [Tannerella sp.]